MADVLLFRGQQIGDGIVMPETLDAPLTPPTYLVGIWRGEAAVSADSRNRLRGKRFLVHMKRADQWAMDQAVSDIMDLVMLRGDVTVENGGAPILLLEQWLFEAAPQPSKLFGFGGRFVAAWPLTFVGETPPVYY